MPERFRLQPTITGSTWGNVWGAMWERPPRGVVADDSGTIAPKWTNREAVAVIDAFVNVAGAGAFPLWYQLAAVAYNWSPDTDALDGSREQADSYYPAYAAVMLQLEAQRITGDLDAGKRPDPQLRLDEKTFDSKGFRAGVVRALASDGARAQWLVPLPACKDPKTGKPVFPKLDPRTGKLQCPGGIVTIDDPLTAILKGLAKSALPIALILVALGVVEKKRRDRRRRK